MSNHSPDQPANGEHDAQQLERFWLALVQGSTPDGGTVRSPAPEVASVHVDVSTPQTVQSTHSLPPHVADVRPAQIDNFELLRRLFEHRQLLAAELGRDTPAPQRTRMAQGAVDGNGPRLRMLGDYQLLEQIGRGGMGVVYKARQLSLGRIVAVKHMRAGKFAYEDEIQRFKHEVETAARLQHANIVAIHEVGVEHGEPYFSMAYIEGKSLSARVREQLLQPNQAARYVSLIAAAVHYAHTRGVIHRDLKPANILINKDDQPLITDFGLAKQFETEASSAEQLGLTKTGDVVGTPSYMSPEQATGVSTSLGPASDIYALGAILYELVTGRPPFRAETTLATLKLVLETEPVAPRLLNPELPRDFENICLKCLAKEPEKRYATAQDLSDDLQRFLQGQPVLARPIGSAEKFWRLCRRHPQLAALSATAIALLMLVAVVASFAAYREQGLRKIAVTQTGIAKQEQGKAVQAQQREAAARKTAEDSRSLAQMELADNLLRRGVAWCEQGDTLRGLLAFARAVESLPTGHDVSPRAAEIDRAARQSIALWSERIHQQTQVIAPPGGITAFGTDRDGKLLITGNEAGEARVWDPLTGKQVGPAVQHGAPLHAVAVSPDGKHIATAGTDEFVRLWRAESGELLRKPTEEEPAIFLADTSNVYRIQRSRLVFTPDGSRLATNIGQSPLIEVPSGQRLPMPKPGYQRVHAVEMGHRGEQFAAVYNVGGTSEIYLVNTATGAAVHQLAANVQSLRSLAFSPDDKQLAVGTTGLTLYDLTNGQMIGETTKLVVPPADTGAEPRGNLAEAARVHRDERPVYSRINPVLGNPDLLRFHPQGSVLAVGSANAILAVGLEKRSIVGRTLRHRQDLFDLRFTADGQWMLSAGHDQAVRLWEVRYGVLSGHVLHHPAPVLGAAFVDRDQQVATVCRDGLVRIWQLASRGNGIVQPLAHGESVSRIASAADAVATHSRSGSLKLWNTRSKEPLLQTAAEAPSPFYEDTLFAFDEAGETLCVRTSLRQVQFWSARTGQASLPTIEAPREVLDLALSRTGALLATTLSSQEPDAPEQTENFAVQLWDTRAGNAWKPPLRACANRLAFSPNEKWLATASIITPPSTIRRGKSGTGREVLSGPDQMHRSRGEVYIWSTATGELHGEPLPITTSVWRIAFSPDSRLLAIAGFDQSIHIWDVEQQRSLRAPFAHIGGAKAMLFTADSRQLITAGSDGTVRVWNLQGANPTGPQFTHYAEVSALALSPDGMMLAVGCSDQSHRLWDLATGEPLGPVLRGGSYVAFDRTGHALLLQAMDGAGTRPLPAPSTKSTAELAAWCRKITGHSLDGSGQLRELRLDDLPPK